MYTQLNNVFFACVAILFHKRRIESSELSRGLCVVMSSDETLTNDANDYGGEKGEFSCVSK